MKGKSNMTEKSGDSVFQTTDPLDPKAWDKRYSDEDTPWDLGSPTPEFLRLIQEAQFTPGKKVLVPGCGRGFDVMALAKHGLSVTALDFSCEALAYLDSMLDRETKPLVELVQDDFFDFASKAERDGAYDYILEYTFFCAIPPKQRAPYAQALARLLASGGKVTGLFFPLEEREGGPPYGVSIESVKESFAANFELEFHSPKLSVKPRAGREVLGIFTKKA